MSIYTTFGCRIIQMRQYLILFTCAGVKTPLRDVGLSLFTRYQPASIVRLTVHLWFSEKICPAASWSFPWGGFSLDSSWIFSTSSFPEASVPIRDDWIRNLHKSAGLDLRENWKKKLRGNSFLFTVHICKLSPLPADSYYSIFLTSVFTIADWRFHDKLDCFAA